MVGFRVFDSDALNVLNCVVILVHFIIFLTCSIYLLVPFIYLFDLLHTMGKMLWTV